MKGIRFCSACLAAWINRIFCRGVSVAVRYLGKQLESIDVHVINRVNVWLFVRAGR